MLGKPVGESTALAIPTAAYGHPMISPAMALDFLTGASGAPMCDLGWKSLGVLELTALPTLDKERWVPCVKEADALLVNGGHPTYLAYWLRQSGMVDLLPELANTVWVGLSAGSMVMTPRTGHEFVNPARSITGDDVTLGLVDFSIFPHLDHPKLPSNTMAAAEAWAAKLSSPAYALDDDSAITVVDGAVEVVSEGNWRYFEA